MMLPTVLPALLAAAAPVAEVNPITQLIITFGPVILIFWFLVWRPQQKQRRTHEQALKGLKRGDEIVTAGGLIGEVIHIKESSKDGGANRMDDRVTIKCGESRLVIERGRIAKILGATTAAATSAGTSA